MRPIKSHKSKGKEILLGDRPVSGVEAGRYGSGGRRSKSLRIGLGSGAVLSFRGKPRKDLETKAYGRES